MARGVYTLGVLLLTSAFWLSAIFKILDFDGAIQEVRGLTGLEPASIVAVLVIAVQLSGSALLIWGGRASVIGAVILSGFTVAATLIAHAWWVKDGVDRVRDFNVFFEHLGLVGGFILAGLLGLQLRRR
ncbi:MAG: DoxX family membrane protein [Hyphomicrobiales bacterium]|nr:DoxX family membrane protein [Hyphomicrobiales bacterium]